MEKYAEVSDVPQTGVAKVKVRRHSSCGNCGKCKGGAEVSTTVKDSIGVQKGDIVILEMAGGELINAALLVYLLPIVAFLAGYIGLTELGVVSEGARFLAGLILFALAILSARAFGKKKEADYELEIIKKL